jgi:thymidylate kinase
MAKGKLFVFEGPDGAGKSTLAQGLADYFRSCGKACDEYCFPGSEKGTLGRHIYYLHHNFKALGIESINSASLQVLHVAAHIDGIERCIIPAINAGRDVILDRFWWSTWVYGMVSGVPRRSLKAMIKLECAHWGKTLPAALFLVQSAFPHRKDVKDDGWHDLLCAYRKLAQEEKDRYPIYWVESSGSVHSTTAQIIEIVEHLC